jgi:glycosyltransferase involved in cell wall biosynthesis
MESVFAQKCRDYEYILIDGGSTDGSRDLIRENDTKITYWVSEPDKGIYAAMNKGIRAARGEYCLFLNSGDWLFDEEVVGYLKENTLTGSEVYYSFLPKNGTKDEFDTYPKELDLKFFVTGCINHQNSVIRRDYLYKFGLYNEKFRIMSDWHFALKAKYRDKIRFKYLDRPIAYYLGDGISADPKLSSLRAQERRKMLEDVFGDLGPTMIDYYFGYKESIYYDILQLGGGNKLFTFCLKAYRHLLRRIAASRHP